MRLPEAGYLYSDSCLLHKDLSSYCFLLLLAQRAGHSTSAAALGDKLPAQIHSATLWRARRMMISLLPLARQAQALPWCSYPCNDSRAGASSGLSYSSGDKVHFLNGLTADHLFASDHPVLYSPVPQREFHPLKYFYYAQNRPIPYPSHRRLSWHMYIPTDFSLDLALKFCLPHPLNSIDFFSHSLYHFLNVSELFYEEIKNPLSVFTTLNFLQLPS